MGILLFFKTPDIYRLSINFLVTGPRFPVLLMLFASWSFLSAALVASPKYAVSLPGEPGPAGAMMKPLVLR